MRGDLCEDYSPNSAQYGTTIAKATTGLWTQLRRTFSSKLEVGVGERSHPGPGVPIIGKNAELGCCI